MKTASGNIIADASAVLYEAENDFSTLLSRSEAVSAKVREKKAAETKPVSRPKTRMVYRQARKRTFTELPTFDRKW